MDFFVRFLGLNTLLFALSAAILSVVCNTQIAYYVGGVIWSRVNGFFTPIRVKVVGKENINKLQSYVIVCNH
jgi:1-acyl-sn-glycerol-3-phosphate acyltransferase